MILIVPNIMLIWIRVFLANLCCNQCVYDISRFNTCSCMHAVDQCRDPFGNPPAIATIIPAECPTRHSLTSQSLLGTMLAHSSCSGEGHRYRTDCGNVLLTTKSAVNSISQTRFRTGCAGRCSGMPSCKGFVIDFTMFYECTLLSSVDEVVPHAGSSESWSVTF
jgi:hypothetical protein